MNAEENTKKEEGNVGFMLQPVVDCPIVVQHLNHLEKLAGVEARFHSRHWQLVNLR